MYSTFALFAAMALVVKASPLAMPQAVTAILLPSDGTAPPGCEPTYSAQFGIAVHNISTAAPQKRQVAEISDGQPQAMTVGHVSMITDGQIQAHLHTAIIAPVAQITDGQIQAPTITMAPVTEYIDGQPQAPTITEAPVTQISDAQPQAPPPTTAPAVSQISDAQPQAPASTATGVSEASDNQPSTPTGSPAPGSVTVVACRTPGTLELSLANGILKDSHGRTGYIASNFQFQFDNPPQAGAIITAGFSLCANGSLALGGTNEFWQCLSGNFYNLYDRNWAAQCSPVTINSLTLINCA